MSQHFLFPTVSCGANSFMEGPKSTLLWRLLLPLYLFVYLFIFSFDASSTFFGQLVSFFFFFHSSSSSTSPPFPVPHRVPSLFSLIFFCYFAFSLSGTCHLERALFFRARWMDGWTVPPEVEREMLSMCFSILSFRIAVVFLLFFLVSFFFNIFFIFSPPRRSHRSEIPPELFPVAGFFSIFCILFSTL